MTTSATSPGRLARSAGPNVQERYLSQEYHDREVEKMWRKVWQMACREEDIPNVGDTIVYDIADDSIVVVRVTPDQIKAYHNSCLHRGTQLARGQTSVASLTCQFHGWSWNLDGTMKSLPCQWDFPQADKEKLTLPEVKVDTWDGWVFVNLDPECGTLADYLGEALPAHFEQMPLKSRFKAAHVQARVPANWKATMEAFIESYHVFMTHPQIVLFTGDHNTQYDVFDEHSNRMITLIGVPSPSLGDSVDDQAECTGQGHGALIPEAQGSGSLALPCVGLVDALKERRADGTTLAGTFDHKHPMIDPAGPLHQLGQMLDPRADGEVHGLVDDGFDA